MLGVGPPGSVMQPFKTYCLVPVDILEDAEPFPRGGPKTPAESLLPKPTVSRIADFGHSTRPIDEFFELLRTPDIQVLAEVRITPYSRHNFQFHSEALAKILADTGIQNWHVPA